MFRALSIVTPRVAVRAAAAAAPRALRAAVPAAGRFLHSAAAVQAPRRNVEQEQEVEEEEEVEERGLVPFPEARSKLVSAVSKEMESFDTHDDFIESYAKDHALSVKVDLASESVVATRESEGHKIHITFRAESLESEEPEEEPQEGEEEQDKMPEHRFHVDVQAPSGKIMRLECFNSPQGELEVGAISFPTAVSSDPATTPLPTPEQEALAQRDSLRVEEMSDEASQALFDYLEAIGIDDDLAVFVSSQAQAVRTQAMIQRVAKLREFAQ